MAPIVLICNRLRADSQSLVLHAKLGTEQKTRRVESAGFCSGRGKSLGVRDRQTLARDG
jgi:hypothetical protein